MKLTVSMFSRIFLIFHKLVAFYEHLVIWIYQEYSFLLLLNEIPI